jgi:PKD repeat protein
LLVVASAVGASAQPYWSLPAATPNTDVPCTGCGGTREGKLTAGYPAVLRYVGRFDDSDSETDYQEAFRVGRARGAFFAPERNRAYFLIGSALAAYNIDNFFTKVAAHTSLTPATALAFNPPRYRDRGTEGFIYWDRFFYAEHVGGWNTPPQDGTDRLFRTGVDWDDRNLCYLAYTVFGWGMVIDNPLISDGGLMENINPTAQFFGDINPSAITSVKTSDGSYYALTSGDSAPKTQVWNVTDPKHAVQMPDQNGRTIWSVAKNSTGTRFAVVQFDFASKIYTADALARGQSPIQTVTISNGAYYAVDSDGTNFYFGGRSNGAGVITVMSPNSSGGYDRKDYPVLDDAGKPVPYATLNGIRAGSGLLAIFGTEIFTQNIRLYKLTNGVPTAISLDNVVNGKHGQFFSQYYANDLPGTNYVHPDRTIFWDVTPYKYNGKTYIIVAAFGLGDVWEVKSGDSLNGSLKSLAETPNPNAQSTSSAGAFYGDRQTFTSVLASGKPTTVNWTFDDGTSGSTLPGTTDIKHQFGGITSAAALPATRHATATDAGDSSVTTTINVPLAKPDVRFALSGTSYLFKLPDASSTAPIVTSDTFADASDGAVEGHYSEWVLDGASTKKLPSELFSAGPCGAHTLNFLGHYGAYLGTGANIASLGSDLPLSINGFVYLSHPFTATVQPPPPVTAGSAPGNAVFTAAVRTTATAADLPAGSATAVNYRWELVSAAGATLQQSAGTATLATIPSFSLDRSVFNTLGSKVRLTATLAAGALSTACAPYAVSTSVTDALNAPDPTLVKSGCDNAGAPCSFSVTSAASQTGWAYAWSMTNSNATSNTSTFAPTITTGGSYTVTLVVTNAIGSATRSITINPAQPLCSSAPSADNTNFGPSGCASTQCTAGEAVTFRVSAYQWNPDPACDTATWNFGDNTSGSGLITQHTYANNGIYSVTLTLKGGSSTATITNPVTIGPVAQQPQPQQPQPQQPQQPQPGVCPAQTSASAYIGFLGPQSFCSATGGACNAGEQITFGGYSVSYNFDCGTTTYLWSFGDGGTSNERITQHSFTTGGTKHVTLSITNSGGTGQYSADVQVGASTPQPCGNLSTQTIAMTFSGNGCTENGGDCINTTAVSFAATGVGYNLGCGTHTFEWDYGDGTPHGTAATASHTYSNTGNYTAKLTVGYGSSSISISKPVHVTAPSGGGNCPLMVADENVYMVYYGTVTGSCSSVGGACPVGEDVQFKASSYNYGDFACDIHSFKWEFGDNATSTEKNPTHKYALSGTYRVKLTIVNKQQTLELLKTIVVGDGKSPVPPRHRAAGH